MSDAALIGIAKAVQTEYASAYGAAGAVILVLLWTYYASQILFYGAEITKTYADKFGSRIETQGT